MKAIKVALVDSWCEDSPEENFLLRILRRHYQLQFSDSPDFVFFSVYGRNHQRFRDCVKILFSYEVCFPDFAYCDYALTLERITVPGRHFRAPYAWGLDDSVNDRGRWLADHATRPRKFCNFIYTNASRGEGAILRQRFCERLARYRPVDCPGPVLNNMRDAITPRFGNWAEGKLAFLRDYRFTIAFENIRYPGYITEKLIQPLVVGSVPIYWGAPDIGLDFNPRSFLDSATYGDDLDALVDAVVALDRDEDAYRAMLAEPPLAGGHDCAATERDLEAFLVSIIERGNRPLDKDPHGYSARLRPGAVAEATSLGRLWTRTRAQVARLGRAAHRQLTRPGH